MATDTICMIAPPFHDGKAWVRVPPQDYGGVQWMMASLIDGYLAHGYKVVILGAPGSLWDHPHVDVVDAGCESSIQSWLRTAQPPLVHDHANFHNFRASAGDAARYLRTWHLTSRPPDLKATTCCS